MNVADWIKKWADLFPEKVAIVDNDRAMTYGELHRRINGLANYLLKHGLKKQDRIAVLLHNCREFLEIFFAASKVGAILVPLNFRLTAPEIRYVINDCTAETLFLGEPFAQTIEGIKDDLSIKRGRFVCVGTEAPFGSHHYDGILEECSSQEPLVPNGFSMEMPHIIMYTSGTTGLPKGVVLSQRKTFYNVLNANIYYQVTGRDKVVVSRPLFHSGGLLVDSLPFLYRGATTIMRRRFGPGELLESIERYAATVVETSATMYRFMLEECDLERYDLSTVKCFFTGGEQVPLPLLRSYLERGLDISQLFGQTETSTITWLPTEYARSKIGSVGIPVFHGEARIVDEEGRDVPPGKSGEIIVSGPILMSGYWGKPDLTAETIRNGWLYTGDLGMRDQDGFYYILDRVTNVFISGGENVYPAEVERILLENPKVAAAAIVGMPDDKWGQAGKAFVVLKEGEKLTQEEVIAWCTGKLAKYKIPKQVEWVERIPENAAGKILRYRLGELSGKQVGETAG